MTFYCDKCSEKIEYHQTLCPKCGEKHAFPNMRAARNEKTHLESRYFDAKSIIVGKKLNDEYKILQNIIKDCCVSICIPFDVVDQLSRSESYKNRYDLIYGKDKISHNQMSDSARQMVDAKLFTGFAGNIYFGALSTKGQGITNYGDVAFYLEDVHLLENRASLLEDNSFVFYETHNLGGLKTEIPKGYRSDWQNREKLAVAKLANKLKMGFKIKDLKRILLQNDADRLKDEFIEVHLFLDFFKAEWFSEAHCLKNATKLDDIAFWNNSKAGLKNKNIKVVE
jgi:hypothetical protein